MGTKHMACDQYSNSALRQQLVQPGGAVIAQPAPQHQVRAARDHMDRIDLQHAHLPDQRQHVLLGSRRLRGCTESLSGEHDLASFFLGDGFSGWWGFGHSLDFIPIFIIPTNFSPVYLKNPSWFLYSNQTFNPLRHSTVL